MSQMRARLHEIADDDAPPSRLSADQVYAAAFQRRRRRATAWAVCGVAAVALVATVGAGVLRAPSGTPTPAQTAEPGPAVRDGAIASIAAADAQHLYAGVYACPDGGTQGCTVNLVGSDDGGRTWTLRLSGLGRDRISAPAPGTVLRTVAQDLDQDNGGPKMRWVPWVSRDGGRTWKEVVAGTGQTAQVPAGGWVQCASPQRVDEHCLLIGIDPVNARSAPLATQPPGMDVDDTVDVPVSGGIWVVGKERGGDHLPAVAVSRDRGRSWAVHVFGRGEADFPSPEMRGFAVPVSTDGVTGYTLITVADSAGENATLVYRTTDSGKTWQRVNPSKTLPLASSMGGASYVAADGGHVVMARTDPPRWYTSTDGGQTYHAAQQPGLGQALVYAEGALVIVAGPDAYLAFDADALYQSADGVRWTRTVIRLPG